MQSEFILSSQDIGNLEKLACVVVSRPKSLFKDSEYWLVKVNPPIRTSYWDEPEQYFEHLLLSLVSPATLSSLENNVLVDIAICPSYNGDAIDERIWSRIGTGTLHSLNTTS